MEFSHISVLLKEAVKLLDVRENGIYVDGTLGGGGHSEAILSSNGTCRVIGIDRDGDAIEAATKRLSGFGERFIPVRSNFSDVSSVLDSLSVDFIDGAVLDLGVSSHQLDEPERGFSYMHDARLDMRMDTRGALTAYDVINTYDKQHLIKIFYEYGEEKWSKRIAEFICEERKTKEIATTGQLSELVKRAVPKAAAGGGHPAKRIFQAIRIEVNGELRILEGALRDFAGRIRSGGKFAVITFHSLEDRIVKNTFREFCTDCICPKDFPVCVCGHKSSARLVNKKPILPSQEETDRNPRAKSAKLRVIEKL